jgi:acetyl-CoA acetyltransferase
LRRALGEAFVAAAVRVVEDDDTPDMTLVARAMAAVLDSTGLSAARLDAVLVGASPGANPDLARLAALAARIPVTIPATGLVEGGDAAHAALHQAVVMVGAGYAQAVLVAGLARGPARSDSPPSDGPEGLTEDLLWRHSFLSQPELVANLAAEHGVTEDEVAEWVKSSQEAALAKEDAAETPRVERCAAAVLVVDGTLRPSLKTRSTARVVSLGAAAVDPAVGPRAVPAAARQALHRLQQDLDEINVVALDAGDVVVDFSVARALDLPLDRLIGSAGPVRRGRARGAAGLVELVDLMQCLGDDGQRFGMLLTAGRLGQARASILDGEVFA